MKHKEKPTDFEKLSTDELHHYATDMRNNGQVDEAVRAYQELIGRFEAYQDFKSAAGMQHMIGVTHKVANRTGQSLVDLAKAKERYQALNDHVGVGRVLRDQGITHAYEGDFKLAQPLLEQSVRELMQTRAYEELGISEVKLGQNFMNLGDFENAEIWMQKGRARLQSSDHWFYKMTTEFHFAELFYKKNAFDESIASATAALHEINAHGAADKQKRRLAQVHGLLALDYHQLGDDEQASVHYKKAAGFLSQLDQASAQYLREKPDFSALETAMKEVQ